MKIEKAELMIKITKGLNLPITGAPEQKINEFSPNVSKCALVAADYIGLKPKMEVQVGDHVKIGSPLVTHKQYPKVVFVSPAQGEVLAVNRGERRVLQSVVVTNEGQDFHSFNSYKSAQLSDYSSEQLVDLMCESGWWVSMRTRPFSKIANPEEKPKAFFVNVMDTNPLAADPQLAVTKRSSEFLTGLKAIEKAFNVPVFVCSTPNFDSSFMRGELKNTTVHHFSGIHPAGNVGTHIHYLHPVNERSSVWHADSQDIIALGYLVSNGHILTHRMISVAGPAAKSPQVIQTRLGAYLPDVVQSQIHSDSDQTTRIISGSILGGRTAKGSMQKGDEFAFLGHFHRQVSLVIEGTHREFLGWQSPGFNKFSLKPVFLSKLFPKKQFAFTTNTNGSLRSIVPTGSFEKVMPLDILPTQLIQALLMKNTERASKLGVLELDEEDIALCTFVDPCKNELGPILRENLDIIEKEG